VVDQILQRIGRRFRRRGHAWREQQPPRPIGDPRQRDADLGGAILAPHRRQAAQVRDQVDDVAVGHASIQIVGHYRRLDAALAHISIANRGDDLIVAPAADAGVGVGRDVRPVERAERRLDLAPPAADRSFIGGVTAAPTGQREDNLTAARIATARRWGRHHRQYQQGDRSGDL
jgi:hypothetical protein